MENKYYFCQENGGSYYKFLKEEGSTLYFLDFQHEINKNGGFQFLIKRSTFDKSRFERFIKEGVIREIGIGEYSYAQKIIVQNLLKLWREHETNTI